MDVATIFGITAVVAVILVDMGKNLSLLFDPVSAVFVVGGTVAVLLISFTLTEFRRAIAGGIRFIFAPPKTADAATRQSLETGVVFFQRASTYAQAVGWIGVFFGTIVMLDKGFFSDPSVWQPGFRVCILTALYGVAIAYVICIPVSTKLSQHLESLARIDAGKNSEQRDRL